MPAWGPAPHRPSRAMHGVHRGVDRWPLRYRRRSQGRVTRRRRRRESAGVRCVRLRTRCRGGIAGIAGEAPSRAAGTTAAKACSRTVPRAIHRDCGQGRSHERSRPRTPTTRSPRVGARSRAIPGPTAAAGFPASRPTPRLQAVAARRRVTSSRPAARSRSRRPAARRRGRSGSAPSTASGAANSRSAMRRACCRALRRDTAPAARAPGRRA